MKKELEKAYQPQNIEKRIYQAWEKSGYFNPNNLPGKRKKVFSISMPPSNVTGELHLGHAVGFTVQDILTRYHRMLGDKTLWLPGTDHAGISTQVMVERLITKEGLDRHKLGRDKFLQRVWQWKKKYGSRITEQTRQIGASCDWSREHFTMDATLTKAVQEAFIKMFKDKLIYRGQRIVNWCPRCASALSDLEVKHQETSSKLWYLRYPLFGSTKYLVVATTRPETMLGDTAVAVNPNDKRYEKYIGKTVLLPIMNREIPIIADRRVDQSFGTGAVKVTPAHDHLDYEIAQDHKLAIINIIGPDNRLTKQAGEFYGQSVQEARHSILKRLEEDELLDNTVDYIHNLARCERCGTPIEPLISKQWFVDIKKLAKPAIKAVTSGKIKIIPQRYEKIYFHWMNNIKDWCISRQLWWGHQIPVWYKDDKIKASVDKPGEGWTQDPDTLDTWFSSGLWTFSTLGWPEKTKDFKTFHPTSVMETSWDILFFWVARMIMMSLYHTGQVPFKTVYLHGLVLDRQGKKMSKSKGTGVDPIPMTEKYGTDAIRLSLVLGTSPGQDFRLYEEKIAGYRNFINKLWNVSRYILSQAAGPVKEPTAKNLADQWILSRLQTVTKQATEYLDGYQFSEAGTLIYEFLWHEFADWYLEATKIKQNTSILHYVLETVIKLAHPFMPFVTEEIWSRWHGTEKSKMLIIQPWPTYEKTFADPEAEKEFTSLKDFIIGARNFRAEHKIALSEKISAYFWGERAGLVSKNLEIVKSLARIENLENKKQLKATGSLSGLDYFIDYRHDDKKIKKEIEKISQYIQQLEQKLANKNFTDKAPKEIVAKEQEKLKEQKERLKKLL
ncbi:MAG: valine--tRNA ligase [Patescibacteria group bacterium]|jgi:valyl-tRNA synthetase